MRKITFPLVVPALASGFIMTFSKTMGTFGGPNVLGVPVQYYTLSTMLRSNTGIGNYGDGFVLAIMLILFAMTTVMINQKVVGTRKSYETIGGRGFMAQKVKLRNFKPLLTAIVVVFQFIIAILPLVLLLWSTFMLRKEITARITSPWRTGLARGILRSTTANRECCSTTGSTWVRGTPSACPC